MKHIKHLQVCTCILQTNYYGYEWVCVMQRHMSNFPAMSCRELRFTSLSHRWPYLVLSILWFSCSRWLLNYLALNLADEGYSRNTSYASGLIFTFLLRWDHDDVRFVIDQHAELEYFNASALKQQSECRHVAPFWHIILWFFNSLDWIQLTNIEMNISYIALRYL